jgi:riboflavin synthase alpha subunit
VEQFVLVGGDVVGRHVERGDVVGGHMVSGHVERGDLVQLRLG